MESVELKGVELEVEVRGSGEPVLLIDMLIADCFVPLLAEPALADRYQLIRYHKRGWVGSTHTPPPVSIAITPPMPRRCSTTSVYGARTSRGTPAARRSQPSWRSTTREGAHAHSPGAHPAVVPAARRSSKAAGPVSRRTQRRPRGGVRHVRGRRERARVDDVPRAARRAHPRRGRAVGQGRRHVLRRRAALAAASGPSAPEQAAASTSPRCPWSAPRPGLSGWRSTSCSAPRCPDIEECTIEGVGHLLQIQRPEPVAGRSRGSSGATPWQRRTTGPLTRAGRVVAEAT